MLIVKNVVHLALLILIQVQLLGEHADLIVNAGTPRLRLRASGAAG
jgi:hypothetical protein